MDREIGRLLSGLEARGLLARTTIAVVGDHGEGLYEHGLKGHGQELYEEQMRVPLLIAQPGDVGAGRRVAAPVSVADVMPSLLEAVLHQPSQRELTGRSFAATLSGGAEPEARPVFVERPHYSKKRLRAQTGNGERVRRGWGVSDAVIDDGFKLVREPARPDALFDLIHDPEEIENVAEAEPARLESLRSKLADRRAAWPVAEPGSAPEIAPEQLEALRALGYLAGEEE
jgi:arylsulfatase A-like enzyme